MAQIIFINEDDSTKVSGNVTSNNGNQTSLWSNLKKTMQNPAVDSVKVDGDSLVKPAEAQKDGAVHIQASNGADAEQAIRKNVLGNPDIKRAVENGTDVIVDKTNESKDTKKRVVNENNSFTISKDLFTRYTLWK